MILMLAPAPNVSFGAMPSGAAYVSDQNGLLKLTNNSVADQNALSAAGCYTLTPFGGWGSGLIDTLADLYAADAAAGLILPGQTGYPRFTAIGIYNDGANNGTWAKTSNGTGAGAWTQVSTSTAISFSTAALTAAQATAAITTALAGASAAVPAVNSPNELVAPNVPSPLAVNASFDVLLTVTNTGETYLTAGGVRLRISDGGGNSIPAGGLVAGMIASLSYSPGGGVFVLTNTRPISDSPAIKAQLATVALVTEQVGGAPIAYPVGGSPNEIIASDAAAPALNATFEVLLTATNTGQTYLTAGGVRRLIADGGGTAIAAGGLVQGTIISLTYSPGGAFVLNSSRPIVAQKSPSGTDDADITNEPWGAVSFPNGQLAVAPSTKYLIVPGSSNANGAYVPNAELPALVGASYLNELLAGDGVTVTGITTAAAGAPMVTIMSQLNACPQFTGGQAKWVIPFYWMNDARTLFYHSQGGILAQIAALRSAIPVIRTAGAEPVLVTGFHPDPRAPTAALDPNWFADTTAFPSGGSTQEMDYPAYHAAPVDPQTQMFPPKSAALVMRDWTGAGVYRSGYLRVWHVNRLIRQLAESTGCVLLDLEASFFRNVSEKLPDLDAGLETYFDSSPTGAGPLHPRPALYDVVVSPVLRAWACDVAQGRTDRRVFTTY